MKRGLAVLLLLIVAVPAAWADQGHVRCLRSIGLKTPLKLQLSILSDSNDRGYVLYQGGSGRIPLKLLKVTELRRVYGGRPSEFETQWIEMSPNGSGGRYVYVNQGAIIDDFRYIRKDGRVFKFEDDLDAFTDDGCTWAAP
ncbi:hypothetical protein [Cyanobium sp. Aljojuca 7A6]|nr:hypothetical protein [Cyanobium sp. Aljojuca 7A6]MCP9834616.1 hypothetical protein [Cyanobium sp. La Preciosa 7G6]MCP9937379.1 hypothetical protein [Cyanobium sp. Aljojuca 7A6]